MDSITIKPKNKKQLKALKDFLTAFNIPFKKEEEVYDSEFIEKIEKAEKEIREGKSTRINNKEELDQFLNEL